jgi:hypothetical protein
MQIDTPAPAHASYVGSVPDAHCPDEPSTSARLSAATRAVLESARAGSPAVDATLERTHLTTLQAAVVARVTVLREDGLRPERVLVTLKRELFALLDAMALDGTPVDGRRADEVLRHLVRWSVEAYHRAD